ncbi:putative disease resistance protein RGA1 [Papaver somniferum]|uniref:putative disease resistance protein RGA1 n=1 Tax=Papaver somniferum TaxID=3469 RepID=UPI000E6FD0DD|nr:putative disease resistance protein RGA1 [Papaver somniferum]
MQFGPLDSITNVIAADVQLGKRETTSYPDEPIVYGRDEDIEYIVNLLQNDTGGSRNDHQGRDVSVVAIVGMGGLGKTTLAQKVFNDRKIMDYFVVRCWICVSDDFSPAMFFRIILRSLGEEVAHDRQTLDYLRSRLQDKLVVALLMATLPHYLPRILSEEDCWSLFKGRAFMHGEDKSYPELEAVGKEIVKKCCGIPWAAKALGGLLQFKREEKQWLNVKDSQVWELQDNSSDAILPALQLSYKHLSSQSKQCFAYCSIYPKDYLMKKEELILLWMANGFIQSTERIMEYEDVGNEIFNDLSWRSFFQDFQKDEGGNVISCKMHDLACSVMSDECVSVECDYSKEVQVRLSVKFPWIYLLESKMFTCINFGGVDHKQNPEFDKQTETPEVKENANRNGEIDFPPNLELNLLWVSITELKDLQYLKGRLRILGLEHVKSAANANLIQKKHLQSLYLCWSSGLPDTEEEEQAQLMVGEGLQPHPKLKRLYIDGYGGVRFPHWIGLGVSLVEITLWECHKCEHLPQLGNLPLLKILRLDNLHSVKSISEFYHHGDQVISFFPSLKELYISGMYHQSGEISLPSPLSHIYRMYHFEKISSPSPLSPSSSSSQSLSSNQVLSFPRLRVLEIRNCPELASFISLPPSLEMLVLRNTHEELLLRYLKQSPSSLERLEIGGFPNLVSVHQNNGLRDLANLRELKSRVVQNWILRTSLPLLTSLRINYCSGLTTLEEWMPNLTSLQYLVIENCKNLNSLSDGLQRPTALVDLRILDCKNLKSFPDDGLERLTALRFLIIKNCHPDLHRQCRNEEGHYWDKISHIPELCIY